MISGDVLKYLNGFFILGRYEAALADSRQVPLTMPYKFIVSNEDCCPKSIIMGNLTLLILGLRDS
jgi:hypothetical protein